MSSLCLIMQIELFYHIKRKIKLHFDDLAHSWVENDIEKIKEDYVKH